MKSRGLKPIEVHSDETPELVERMKKEFPNDVVLTVGHSNSVPRLLKILGVTETVEIAHEDYDNLFIVVPAASGPADADSALRSSSSRAASRPGTPRPRLRPSGERPAGGSGCATPANPPKRPCSSWSACSP